MLHVAEGICDMEPLQALDLYLAKNSLQVLLSTRYRVTEQEEDKAYFDGDV